MAIAMPVGAADVVDVLMGVQLGEDFVLRADLDGLVAVDDFGTEVVDAAAAEVDVDHGADVGAVEAGDEGVENVDVAVSPVALMRTGCLEPRPSE